MGGAASIESDKKNRVLRKKIAAVAEFTTSSAVAVLVPADKCGNSGYISVGSMVRAVDIFAVGGAPRRKWREAEVIALGVNCERILLRFFEWHEKHDRWLNIADEAAKDLLLNPRYRWASDKIDLEIGSEVFAKDIFRHKLTKQLTHKWRLATILEIKIRPLQAKVNFKGWDSKWDEFLLVSKDPKTCRIRCKVKDRINNDSKSSDTISNASNNSHQQQSNLNPKKTTTDNNSHQQQSNLNPKKTTTDRDPILMASRRKEREEKSSKSNSSIQKAHIEDEKVYRNAPKKLGFRRGCHPALVFKYVLPGEGGRVGLTNIGNTCFMNTCIQCIAHIPAVAVYFSTHQDLLSEKDAVCVSGVLSKTNGKLAKEFAKLTQIFWNLDSDLITSFRPKILKDIFSEFAPQFAGSEQHDAHEFLRFLLDGLHEDLNSINIIPPYEEILCGQPDERDNEVAKRWWTNYERRNQSFIKDQFAGQLRNKITCKVCKFSSLTFDPFWDLSLPLEESLSDVPYELNNCLESFAQTEILSGNEKYFCRRCRKHCDGYKSISVWKPPRVLVLHIKRFLHTNENTSKINTQLSFPQQGLNLAATNCLHEDAPRPVGGAVYDLMSVCNHIGSCSNGHYTSDCIGIDKSWYNFDDEKVVQYDEGVEKNTNHVSPYAYILFYVRRGAYAATAEQLGKIPKNKRRKRKFWGN